MPEATTLCSRCGGSGAEPGLPSAEAIRCYMRVTGWQPQTVGHAGTLWTHSGIRFGRVGVMHDMEPGSEAWRGLIERLARLEGRTFGEVISAVSRNQRIEPARD
jgi:hypothetical protein